MSRIILWFIIVGAVVGIAGYGLRRFHAAPAQTQTYSMVQPMQPAPQELSKAQSAEWRKMMFSLRYGAGLNWRSAAVHAMLKRANWMANRLNLPIQRPILVTDILRAGVNNPSLCVAMRPAPTWDYWYPDTVLGTRICDTNIPGRERIAALKIQVNGDFETRSFEFNFTDGQLMELARNDIFQDVPYPERYERRASETIPSLTDAAQAYQVATQWLAAVDVNLTLLEQSRLPQAVHQGEYQPPGAGQPVPVYFVDWGTNYYKTYYYYKNHAPGWHPAVTVEIGPAKELLQLYVGDPGYFRSPPMLITNAWQLVRTPDPSEQQLQNPALREALGMSEPMWLYYSNAMFPPLDVLTNGVFWKAQHNLLPARAELEYSNELSYIRDVTNNP